MTKSVRKNRPIFYPFSKDFDNNFPVFFAFIPFFVEFMRFSLPKTSSALRAEKRDQIHFLYIFVKLEFNENDQIFTLPIFVFPNFVRSKISPLYVSNFFLKI